MFQQFYSNMNSMFPGMQQQGQGIWDQSQGLQSFFQNLMGQGTKGAEGLLGGGSVDNTDEIMERLMSSMESMSGGSNLGKMYNSIVGGEGNTYMDPMVDAMKRSSIENYDLLTNRVGLDAASVGQGGSSRHAMTNAILGRTANQDMLDRETMMRGSGYDKDLAIKMDIAGKADLGVGQMQDRLSGLLGRSDQNTQFGMGSLGGLGSLGTGSMDPGMMAMMMPYMLMQMQGNAMGDPTKLGKANSSAWNAETEGSFF